MYLMRAINSFPIFIPFGNAILIQGVPKLVSQTANIDSPSKNMRRQTLSNIPSLRYRVSNLKQ